MCKGQARRVLRLLAGVALLTGLGLTAQAVHAQTYTVVYLTVNTTADNPAATCGTPGTPPTTPPHISGPCSLRGVASFSNSASSSAHYYAIYATVPAGTYLINPAYGAITFSNAYSKTHLNGASLYNTFVDGQNGTQIFFNNGSNLTIQQMTLQHGNGSGGDGGAVYSTGAFAMSDSVVQNSSATGYRGGGLSLAGSVVNLSRVTVRYNEATYGGGLYITATSANLYNVTVNNNLACITFTAPSTCGGDGEGGGLFSTSNISIQGGSFANNVAGSLALSQLSGEGGAIFNGYILHGVNLRLTNNIAGNAGGGYYSAGPASPNPCNAGVCVDSINTSSILYNQAGSQGGGLWVAGIDFLTGSVVNNNTAGVAPTSGASPTPGNNGFGGGMYIASNSNGQQFAGDTFQANSALTTSTTPVGTCGGEGGGLYNAADATIGGSHFLFNLACDGGGIFNDASSYGYLSLNNSSLTNNTARIQGGGIYSTFAGQPARIAFDGTGITGNSATDAGGFYDSNDPASYLVSTATVILGNNATGGSTACRNIGDVPCT